MPSFPSVRTRLLALAGAGLLAGSLSACSGSSGADAGSTAASSGGDAHTANVTITAAHGCQPDRTQFAAGGITVKVHNADATAVSEVELLSGQRIVGEKENLPPGLSGEFAVTLGAGSYTLYCPGAATEKTTITVTGTSHTGDTSVAALLKTATGNYAKYVSTQVGYLVAAVQKLDTALHGTDLAAAQDAYKQSRPFYEKIEPVAESFTIGKDSLDADIDARANDVPAAQWKGFHRIEKGLFADKALTGLAPLGDGLVANVKRLQQLTTGLTYQPTELANGAQELMDEVAGSKITGEEERYSHIDLLDIANNDEGAEQAFAQLQPALEKIDPTLSATIQARFAALDKLVEGYRSTTDASGYVLFTTLTQADKRQLAAAVKAVQEPLSQVASKVANA
ncbi:MAG TPA: iron uptake system protein EfeO [Jatrophihabitantaceae bacterium]|nr:iron uptake system protein EfeO [Jatrophihabitantaceae bacterium]